MQFSHNEQEALCARPFVSPSFMSLGLPFKNILSNKSHSGERV